MPSYIQTTTKSSDFSSLNYYLSVLLHKISFGFLIFLSVVLIISSKVNNNYIEQTRHAIYFVASPMIDIIGKPVNFSLDFIRSIKTSLTLSEENKKLRTENLFFKKKYLESLNIQSENEELKKLLHFTSISENFDYKTAYIKGNAEGFDSSNIVIMSGKNEGIQQGYSVTGYNGMIGRIASTSEHKSRIILITDLNSRIPVIIVGKEKRNKAILSGNNSKHPEIIYLSENHGIEKGDKVFTSGDGDALPSGLYIGNVSEINEEDGKVLPIEDFNNIDTVLILEKKTEDNETVNTVQDTKNTDQNTQNNTQNNNVTKEQSQENVGSKN
jgi:rod shape-determining protein MreC